MASRILVRFLPVVLVALAVVSLAGCAGGTGGTRGSTCDSCAPCSAGMGPCGPLGPPSDLPKDPFPCTKYCKVWVPPVYRKVPRLEQVCGGPRRTEKDVIETCFVTECVKPRQVYGCTTPSCDCDEVAVQVCPGGYRWQQAPDGCWRYCSCEPKYKWCKKHVHEDGITYCGEIPPEYRTVAVRNQKRVCDTVYEPGTWKTVWCEECYKPGHWEWRAVEDCCAPAPNCDCCAPRTYPISSRCSCSK